MLASQIDALNSLTEERWGNHKDKHADLAAALAEYKVEANEWRNTLNDLRSTFVTDAEWKAEHRALLIRMEVTERALLTMQNEAITTRGLFANGRNLLLLIVAMVGVSVTVIAYFNRA